MIRFLHDFSVFLLLSSRHKRLANVFNASSFVSFQLLNIVRDNQVIIVVGETGSGKTTQLTQVRKNSVSSKQCDE